ncbi:hypothetical protein CURE108131_21335 [Cupriavidus respiraculi]|uniref:Lipoprotein n=1 Tax=Cupriavidus respiraculi TaxID=195930 RepID=A0ABN7YL22_9BURK|nr:hypothetical protein [Cupriavidus respiraculi]CAG9172840.1 hypothetical protein LMG21510_02087 [Cupriavidus respiraculi]
MSASLSRLDSFRRALPSALARRGLAATLALAGAAPLGGCATELPRDINGSPPTARLVPNAVPPAPLSAQERERLAALNEQVLRDQEAAIARDQQAAAWARAYSYPRTSYSLYYGGWGGGGWGGGVSVGSPGYWGWGGYPYWW